MTTSVSTASVLPDNRQNAPTAGMVRASQKTKTPVRLVMAIVAVAIIAVAGWAAVSRIGAGRLKLAVDKHVVKQESFTVLLKEKGELKAAKSKEIKSEVEGRSTIISLVPEGTAVKEGDLLVELASDEIDERIRQEELKEANALTAFEAARSDLDIQRDKNASDIRKAELDIELKTLELEKYKKGDWLQKLRDAEIAIEQAKILLDREREEFEAAKQLRGRKFMTETEYKEDEFNYLKAEWDLEKARNALEVLKAYTYVSELKQKESDVDEAKKEADRVRKNALAEETKKQRSYEGAEKELSIIRDQLTKLRRQKEKCRITAPTQGFVVYYGGGGGGGFRMMSNDGQIKEGAEVFERQVILELPDTSEMMVVCRVHEAKTDKLKLGQSVVAMVEGVPPDKRFTGKVTKIAVLADTQNRWLNPDLKEYETEITLNTPDIPLKPGVTAHVEIFVEKVEDRLAVPVQSVYTKGGHRFVFQDKDGSIEPVEVSLGAVGTEWVEVLKGLAEGDRVALATTEEQRRLLPELQPGADQQRGGPRGNAMRGRTGPGSAGVSADRAGTAPGKQEARRMPEGTVVAQPAGTGSVAPPPPGGTPPSGGAVPVRANKNP